jgi:hypothetical protein
MKWEKIFADATRLKLPDIQRHRALYDFLNALRIVDVAFVTDREAILKDKISRNEDPPTLKNLLKNFRNHLRTTRALASLMTDDSSHEAFATLQEKSDGETTDQKRDEKIEISLCLCETAHRFSECSFIRLSIRLAG